MRFLLCFLFLTGSCSIMGQSAADLKKLTTRFDSILSKTFTSNGPGATVIISKGDEILYKKAFGLANLENKVPMKPDMVFRIGSVTKQFTAVSILRLAEQGKLNLQDEITRFLPDYPVQGKKITIEHLLTHTSGIRSYTDMEEFNEAFMAVDKKPSVLVDFFKSQPMEFEPGTQWHYNNSGYVLLGVIIEKITGMSYAKYIEDSIFRPLQMTRSLYGSNSKIVADRATGYDPSSTGVQNASYLSMTLPYAAGSLMSTVEDLYKWSRGLRKEKLLKHEWLEKAVTGYKLKSGRNTNYGYGWFIGEIGGQKVYEHSGGINGYLSDALYLPGPDIYMAILSNCTCKAPSDVLTEMAGLALNVKTKFKKIAVDSTALNEFVAVYESEEGDTRTISRKGGTLQSQRKGGSLYVISPYEKDKFYFEGTGSLIRFSRDAQGKVNGMFFKSGINPEEFWKKTDKEVNPVKRELKLTAAELSAFEGEYQLTPGFSIVTRVKGDGLFAQATQQPEFELFAAEPNKFFLKVVDAQVEFVKDEKGQVTHLILYQGGQEMKMRKIR